MAAPATLALLAERLYAIGVEAEALSAACRSPPGAPTAANRVQLEQAAKPLTRFVRDFARASGNRGAADVPLVSSHYEARSATEVAANMVLDATTCTTTAAATVITAILVGQNQTDCASSINAATAAHAQAANLDNVTAT